MGTARVIHRIRRIFICVHWRNSGWIDQIDQQMVQLFEERMQVVAEVMAVKKAAGLPILDASREEAVVAKNTARLSDPALADYYERLIRQMMALSREYQAKLMEE